eukprot:6201827-Pleurochrysis_carterae.AAC.5
MSSARKSALLSREQDRTRMTAIMKSEKAEENATDRMARKHIESKKENDSLKGDESKTQTKRARIRRHSVTSERLRATTSARPCVVARVRTAFMYPKLSRGKMSEVSASLSCDEAQNTAAIIRPDQEEAYAR